MPKPISRRDFLRLAGAASGAAAVPRLARTLKVGSSAGAGRQNVLIVVFDAWSAYNMSIYGYGRETTPDLGRLAERAIVYHNHYAAGNYTTPGVASLLTGVYPWTHRALRFMHPVAKALERSTLLHALPDYYRIAYTHNMAADRILTQFDGGIDEHVAVHQLMLAGERPVRDLLKGDEDIASLGLVRTFREKRNSGFAYSLFLSELYERRPSRSIVEQEPFFPRGLPFSDENEISFVLEEAVDYLEARLADAPKPFLGYFHFFPPHEPYRTRLEFSDRFYKDEYQVPEKPEDLFNEGRTAAQLERRRRAYDEFILYVDHEFARLFEMLESAGVLQDTWIMLTSDHGELFERGISGHITPVLYQPVLRVPLVIFEPGRTSRLDIRTATSAVDILPTVQQIAGREIAEWAEGRPLPPFGQADSARSIYAVHSKNNRGNETLSEASLMLVQGDYKLTRMFGYPEFAAGSERVELYNVVDDPEELQDLYAIEPAVGRQMLETLNQKFREADAAYL